MAISFIQAGSAAATTANLSGNYERGDMLMVFAYRNAVTAPNLAAGFTALAEPSANSNSYQSAYKIITDSDINIGTWPNANVVLWAIYRGCGINPATSAVGALGSNSNSSASTCFVATPGTLNVTAGTSWVVSLAGSNQTSSMSTPAGSLRASQVGSGCMAILYDTAGGVTSLGTVNSSLGSNAVSSAGTIELVKLPEVGANNFQFLKAGDGISVSEKIR